MANDRDIDINLIGHDRTGRATRSAADNMNRLQDRVRGFTSKVSAATEGTRKMIGAVGALGSIIPAVAAVTVKAAIAVGKYLAQIGPAAAALLPLAAGIKLVQMTMTAAGPAMVKAIEPVTNAWKEQTEVIGKLASKGLRPLAADFVRVNFPAIESATSSIARSINYVTTGYLKWANTSGGMRVIRDITKGTADTVKRLAPSVLDLMTSISKLAGRASGAAFKNVGDGADYLLRKITKLTDSISKSDVDGAFDKIRESGRAVASAFRKIGDAIKWVEENRKTIDAIRTSMALLAIVFGGPVTAIIGAVSLVILYWDKLKAIFLKAKEWIQGAGDKFKSLRQPLDAAKDAVRNVKEGFLDFVERIKPSVGPAIDRIKDAWIRMQPWISIVITEVGKLIKTFLRVAGPIVAKVITGVSLLIEAFSYVVEAVAEMAAAVLEKFGDIVGPIAKLAKKMHLPYAKELGEMAADAKNAAGKIRKNLAEAKSDLARREIERLQKKVNSLRGKKVKTEADKDEIRRSIAKIGELQAKIRNTNGKSVNIKVTTSFYQKGKAPGSYGKGLGVLLSSNASTFQSVAPGANGTMRTGGPQQVTVRAGDVAVDSRVYLDGDVIRSVARKVVRQQSTSDAHRARVGTRR